MDKRIRYSTNIHLFNEKGKLKKYEGPEEILYKFFKCRKKMYNKRYKHLLDELGNPGEVYNICSGESTKITYLLQEFCKLSNSNIITQIDKNLYRPVDEIIRIGDPTKLKLLGWSKKVSFNESIERILNYWREFY